MTESATQYPYNAKINGCFVVQNIISNSNKTIRIFDYPITVGQTRDLLKIPNIDEAEIRASLLKGTLRNKLLAGEIRIICSDIDLIQFNDDQKAFLLAGGVIDGLEGGAGGASLEYAFKNEIALIGTKDGVNRTFYTPDKFINGSFNDNSFHIDLKHNGKSIYESIDYTIGESEGPGTGYDTINLIQFAPLPKSTLFASYAVRLV